MKAFRELVNFCVSNSKTICTFNTLTKIAIIEIIENYIVLEGKFQLEFLY